MRTVKIFAAVLAVMFATSCAYSYSGGDGTITNPYVIATVDDLAEMGEGYYTLASDLTIGGDWETLGTFSGHLDGNNHTITTNDAVLLGTVYGTIRNLNVAGEISRSGGAGGIALELRGGTIESCSVNLELVGMRPGNDTYDHADTGGIVAVMRSGNITNCNVKGTIRVNTVTFPRAGGITALMYDGNISSCSVSSEITTTGGSAIAGGIAGQVNTDNTDTISGCTFSGNITSTRYAGGIAGFMRGGELRSNKTVSGAEVSGMYAVGGIVGSMDMCAVKDNISYATVSGTLYIRGGIIGKRSSVVTGAVSGNVYYGTQWGIGEDADGQASNDGCLSVPEEDYDGGQNTNNTPNNNGQNTNNDTPGNNNNNTSNNGQNNNEDTDTSSGNSDSSSGCNTGMGFIVLCALCFCVRKSAVKL